MLKSSAINKQQYLLMGLPGDYFYKYNYPAPRRYTKIKFLFFFHKKKKQITAHDFCIFRL